VKRNTYYDGEGDLIQKKRAGIMKKRNSIKTILTVVFLAVVVSIMFVPTNIGKTASLLDYPAFISQLQVTGKFTGSITSDNPFYHTIAPSPSPCILEISKSPIRLPLFFTYGWRPISTDLFLARTGTLGLLVIKDNKIVFERYYNGSNNKTKFISWSVAKSITSALVGIAISQGYISSVDDLASDYAPELLNTAYRNVSIKDLLQMSSGVSFDENYSSLDSDILTLFLSLGGSFEEYIMSMTETSHPAGTYRQYKSSDTQVLAMVLNRATGQSLSSYMETNLWNPIGAESSAVWLTDRDGVEAAFCGIGATLRDYAKFGLLYLRGGIWRNRQILPTQWVSASIDTSAPQLKPGVNPLSDDIWGYGYQWWIPDNKGDYMAVGVLNQFIYINPAKNIVIVKNSVNPTYLINEEEDEHLAFFRELTRRIY
jgi:hypothetical protein